MQTLLNSLTLVGLTSLEPRNGASSLVLAILQVRAPIVVGPTQDPVVLGSFEKALHIRQRLFHQPHQFLPHRVILKIYTIDQAKKKGIREAIDMVLYSHALMLLEIDKYPRDMRATMDEHYQKLIRTLK